MMRSTFGPLRSFAALILFACLLALPIAGRASAADAPSPKIQQFVDLLADPEVRAWITENAARAPHPAPAVQPTTDTPRPEEMGTMSGAMSERVGSWREQLVAFVGAVQALPGDLATTWSTLLHKIKRHHGLAPLIALLIAFVVLGYGARRLYFMAIRPTYQWLVSGPAQVLVAERVRIVLLRFVLGLGLVGSFALGSIGSFLLVDWPTAPRRIVLAYLLAYVCVQLAATVGLFLLSPPSPARPLADNYRILPINSRAARFWNTRLIRFTAWLAFGMVTVELLASFGLTQISQNVLYDALAFGTLLMALECAWRAPKSFLDEGRSHMWHHMGHPVLASLVSAYLVILWLFWTGNHPGFFAILLLIVALPALIDLAQRAISHILRPPGAQEEEGELQSVLGVILERAVRAVLITAAAVFLGHVSGIGFSALASRDTMLTWIVRSALDLVVIGLVADLIWQVARVLIDVKLRESTLAAHPSSSESSRQARLLTLLPILRNVLFMVITVIALMMALASLGVQIGPLIASAGVVGVAVGFGAQTLVRDILSGVFYLLDDAFRVGEYIQSGNYKGVVESFSLRSVKLRHQRGPIYTVPFGALGAVQNMSRDWTIEKMSVTVAYATNLSKVKPLIKEIGKELLADPELAPHIIETLKLQGIEAFTDYGILLRLKMTTKPGEQAIVRRRAFALIKQAFDANGIEFAVPLVQINGAAEAAAAHQGLELVRAARASSAGS